MHRNKLYILTIAFIFLLQWFAYSVNSEHNISLIRSLNKNVYPWVRIDCIKDSNPNFAFEPFHIKSRVRHEVLKKAFGTETPHSSNVLVHFAPKWNKSKIRTPILLIHGAATSAFHSWCHPYKLEVPQGTDIKKPGLMQFLVSKGYSVFALTFSHYHGDNFYQAQQIANAISYIKKALKRGNDFKIDLICHSKGAMPTRIYLSGLNKNPKLRWRTKYRNDVRNCIFMGSPLNGLDTPFRYYIYNSTVISKEIDAPTGADRFLYMGMYLDLASKNKFFPGQFQMLHNFVDDGVPLTFQSSSYDFNLSALALYNGGITGLLSSKGINYYIKKYGNVIERLNKSGIPKDVNIYVIAGSKQAIDHIKVGFFDVPIGEMAAPSDGVLFLKSSTYTKGLTSRGAKIKDLKVFDTHHVGLLVIPEVFNQIHRILK